MNRFCGALVVATCLCTAAVVVGCAAEGPAFVDEGGTYEIASIAAVADSVDLGEIADTQVTEALTLRHEALVSLRGKGTSAAEAAALITRTFPSETRGVPLLVERARVAGAPAWILVEAVGPKSGKFSNKRIWVIGDDGEIIYSATR